jgi:DNA repair protein RecN (Recombination protein N)
MSRAFINDTPVQISFLKQFGDLLVDFHGQHDHQILLKAETHIGILDIIAKSIDLRDDYRAELDKLKLLIFQYNDSIRKEKSLKERADFIKFESKEIEKIAPQVDEDLQINEQLKIKENSELLHQLTSQIYSLLYNEENSVYNQLQVTKKTLNQLSSIDSTFNQFLNDFSASIINIQELSKYANEYLSNIDFDPQSIENLRERYISLNGLIKKYGSLNSAIKRKIELIEELNLSENFDFEISEIKKKILQQKQIVSSIALKLSNLRKQKAIEIEQNIIRNLKELGIIDANFKIQFSTEIGNNEDINKLNCWISDVCHTLFDDGIDKVEFYISTNKGESPKPLAVIASGGEISRVMLAIKGIVGDSESLPIFIFDEIDTGISGRIAQKVGIAMKKLSNYHQIISITHLPQICALADLNVYVEKYEKEGRTLISAKVLDKNERLKETARLISGEIITDSSLKSAKELMNVKY